MKSVLLVTIMLLAISIVKAEIELKSIDTKSIKVENMGGGGPFGNIGNALKELVMKLHFRDKYMKKKGIEEMTAELEDELTEAEFEYSSLSIRDGGETVWIMCNDAQERARIRAHLIQKEIILVVESDGKRFFGKFGSKVEKD